ncbi:unnamed protein product [Peronospora belbahrii]|uniref:Cystatin domain-containing protein n=1 Tax=Peronospora belbahrii TaxID=622444 RepID=A0AAU9L810_9STRA|nr:unnamed protein product [Peronospora belbahrii]CAH0513593.1 unnamed protein product [Peronospora belbahrii]
MAFVRLSVFCANLVVLLSSAKAETIVGGYTPQHITDDAVDTLVKALSNTEAYHKDVNTLICLIAIENFKTQTVAGTNYMYQVAGCAVESEDEMGACNDRECDYSSYDIIVYSQPWTNTLQVRSITPTE